MSFESLPQGVCLIVQYHGAKALYFSDGPINPTAAMLFRQDLKEMRFPFPKAANIRLAPGATVVAWWPDVSRRTHPVLYNHLINNTNAAPRDGHLVYSSIRYIGIRDIGADGHTFVQLASAKQHDILSPTPQGLSPPTNTEGFQSFSSAPLPHSGPRVPKTSTPALSVEGLTTNLSASNVSAVRTMQSIVPTSQAAPAHPAQVSKPPPTQNCQPTPAPIPPISPRHLRRQRFQASSPILLPQSPAPAPHEVTTISAQATPGQRPRPSPAPLPPTQNILTPKTERSVAQCTSATRAVSNAPGMSSTQLAAVARGVPTTQPVSSVLPTPLAQASESQTRRDQLLSPGLAATSVVPQKRPALDAQEHPTSMSRSSQGSNGGEVGTLRKRMKPMKEMLRPEMTVKARLDETANKLREEREERKRLEEMLSAAREGKADAKRRLHEVQRLFEEERRQRREVDDILAATRREAQSYRDSRDKAKQQQNMVSSQYDTVREELSYSRRNEDKIKDQLDRVVQKFEQELKEETDRCRRYRDQLGDVERSEAALKQRCDEAIREVVSLKRMRDRDAHDTSVAKRRDENALRRCEEMLRTEQIVTKQAEGAMHAAQNSERALRCRLAEVESRLKEVKSGLEAKVEAERRLRREAEDAIADIRRECRKPFVVPSLLDAFVELAKLTTAATTSDGAVTTSAGKESVKMGDTPPATNNARDVAATANVESKSPLRHITPQSALCSQPSTHFVLRTPRLNVFNSPDILPHRGSPAGSNRIKLESE